MYNYRIVEYVSTGEFFIYDLSTGVAHFIDNKQDQNNLRAKKNIYVSYSSLPLERISINITGKCNMSCEHCYFSSILKPKDLPLQLIESLFPQLYQMGVLQVGLTGGEPTMHPQLVDIVKIARKNKLIPTLVTNGVLLTPLKMIKLYEAGLNIVGISFDSISEKTFNYLRKGNNNSLKILLKNISDIYSLDFVSNNANFRLNLATVISKPNIDEIEEIFYFLNSLNKPVRWQLNYVNFIGNAKKNISSLQLTKEEIVAKVNKVLFLAEHTQVTLTFGRFINELAYYDKTKNQLIPLKINKYIKCCGKDGEFEHFCVINFDGNVYPCTNLIDNTIGNVYDTKMIAIWENENMKKYKEIIEYVKSNLCHTCSNNLRCVQVGVCKCSNVVNNIKNDFPNLQIV
jgi:radical SAM protein with 4Fe4S-binding SPASM domain